MAYRSSLFLVLAVGLWPLSASAQTWSGVVRDIRNLEPLANSRICAGINGRVDLACTDTDAAGAFSVSYPENSPTGTDGLWYLFVNPPAGADYYNQVRARAVAGEAECLLIPRQVHIRTRVTDANTGVPIEDMGVCLIRVGAVEQTLRTDANGMVIFEPMGAFMNAGLQYNTYGVPPEDLPPDSDDPLVYIAWQVTAPCYSDSLGYAQIAPTETTEGRWDPELELLSSLDPEVYTFVELRLPPEGTTIDDPADYIDSQIGPPDPAGGTGGTGGTASGGEAGSSNGGTDEAGGAAGNGEGGTAGSVEQAGTAGSSDGGTAGSAEQAGTAGTQESGGSEAGGAPEAGTAGEAEGGSQSPTGGDAGEAGSEQAAGAAGDAGTSQAGVSGDDHGGQPEAGEDGDEPESGEAGAEDDDDDEGSSEDQTSTTTAGCGCSVPADQSSLGGSAFLLLGLLLSRRRAG